MNRVQEKVRDLVEVRSNQPLTDYSADPSVTLSGYHFTDITADLMVKWLDRVISMPDPAGSAYALAGFRGVGKSHFLATFGAILSRPELRQRIRDSHVSAGAERLVRRHYPVAYILRGTKATVVEEVQAGIAELFGVTPDQVGDTAEAIVDLVASKAGASPAVLIIDTDLERERRVTRDDGTFLSELAEAAKGRNVFVAVALDDDIAGADGRNSAIARSFTIDYLDHEHLYKIIDAHIFPKIPEKRNTLKSIYSEIKGALAGFRWSEQRFSSVYPLHPAVIEAAPFVRLYVQNFALLTFASEAGAKVMGRPADSLIALDELFDGVEPRLRRSPELADAFAAFDHLNAEIVSKIPVLQRLKAKLVLQGLLVLSLNGEGCTAGDIAAAMLLFDDPEQRSATEFVEDLLRQFKEALPDAISESTQEGRATKFGLRLSRADDLESVVSEALAAVPDSAVAEILRRLMQERFSDCDFVQVGDEPQHVAASTRVEWRGGLRLLRLSWQIPESGPCPDALPGEISAIVAFGGGEGDNAAFPRVRWAVDELKREETEAFKRYLVLASDSDLQERFRDQMRTVVQSQMITIEKIWERKFLQYGALYIDGRGYTIDPSALSANTLAELFEKTLAPYFEERFTAHPNFKATLDLDAVAMLTSGLYGGGDRGVEHVRPLVIAFAKPFGLVGEDGSPISPSASPNDNTRRLCEAVESLVASAGGGVVSLAAVSDALTAEPFGLPVEAQYLLLSAMVAERQIEFVTSSGDRIGRRSLDLRIIWDDICGIARPAAPARPVETLWNWVGLLAGVERDAKSYESDPQAAAAALRDWLRQWNDSALAERFRSLPDGSLGAGSWRVASRAAGTFSAAADAVALMLADQLSLDECLMRIADAFSHSDSELQARRDELAVIEAQLQSIATRNEMRRYLAECRPTGDAEIDRRRADLAALVEDGEMWGADHSTTEIEALWQEFRSSYAREVIAGHKAVQNTHELKERIETVLGDAVWWEFQALSGMDVFPRDHWRRAQRLLRRYRTINCRANVAENLELHPFCACGFGPGSAVEVAALPDELREAAVEGLRSYRSLLRDLYPEIMSRIAAAQANGAGQEYNEALTSLAAALGGGAVSTLNDNELAALITILKDMPPVRVVAAPVTELAAEATNAVEWFDEIEDEASVER
ncbi:MAG: hypothetical protein ACK4S4_09695 [Pyrinomonadaceae bacterium]